MFHSILEKAEKLNDEQFGKLMRAIFIYSRDGKLPDFKDDERIEMAFDFIKADIDNDKENYNDKCEKNRQIALGRWQKKDMQNNDNANGCERMRTDANDANTIQYNNSYNLNSSFNNLHKCFNDNNISPSNSKSTSLNTQPPLSQDKPDDIHQKGKKQSKYIEKEKYILTLFDKIWVFYPKKVGKEQARKTWTKKLINLKTSEEILNKSKVIFTLLNNHIKSWKDDGRTIRFIPHFSSWLNDEIPDKGV